MCRSPHRREKGEKAPMFERSEFRRRTLFSRSAGHRRTAAMGGGFIAQASVRRGRFGSFCQDKRDSRAQRAKALDPAGLPLLIDCRDGYRYAQPILRGLRRIRADLVRTIK